jgi:hypothetical protein
MKHVNPLNAELNSICYLLVLLGDLTFMGTCIVSIFQYISNKMQRYTVYLYLETVLHVSGGTFTHHQERIQLYLQHLVFVTPLLLSAAIVQELEPVWVCCGWRTPPTAHSNQFQLFVWQIPDAVDTVVCAPDDGWRYHTKHVEQFPDINKLCKVASCLICILQYIIYWIAFHLAQNFQI